MGHKTQVTNSVSNFPTLEGYTRSLHAKNLAVKKLRVYSHGLQFTLLEIDLTTDRNARVQSAIQDLDFKT